jgi:hemoglobin-like flavoprotein
MTDHVQLLRSSFALISERQPRLTKHFYDILFHRYPAVVPLFAAGTRSRQEETLGKALAWLVDHIDDSALLATALPRHGAKHATYGVTEEMYDWVGEALLAALADAAGEDWTPDLAGAWTDTYRGVAALMIAGAAAAAA